MGSPHVTQTITDESNIIHIEWTNFYWTNPNAVFFDGKSVKIEMFSSKTKSELEWFMFESRSAYAFEMEIRESFSYESSMKAVSETNAPRELEQGLYAQCSVAQT